jgi:Spx/MgsR family transcriptional regulator
VSITVYGIPNCDTMKKARVWLDGHGIAYTFHDYKKAGIDAAKLRSWCNEMGWAVILNRAGTTFRALPEDDKVILEAGKAIALMLAQPSMIKRPIIETGGKLIVGFKPDAYAAAFG